jgi:hypothetical protein
MANNVFMTLSFEVKGLSAALDLAPVSITVSVLHHTENQISSRRKNLGDDGDRCQRRKTSKREAVWLMVF